MTRTLNFAFAQQALVDINIHRFSLFSLFQLNTRSWQQISRFDCLCPINLTVSLTTRSVIVHVPDFLSPLTNNEETVLVWCLLTKTVTCQLDHGLYRRDLM